MVRKEHVEADGRTLRVEAARQSFAESFKTAGYDLSVSERDGTLVVTITAGPAACEECLIGKEIMPGISAHTLGEQGVSVSPQEVELVYPTGHD